MCSLSLRCRTLCAAAPRAQHAAAAPRQQQQQEQLASLALTSLLLSPAGAALAEEAAAPAADAAAAAAANPLEGAFNFSGGELALVTAPLVLVRLGWGPQGSRCIPAAAAAAAAAAAGRAKETPLRAGTAGKPHPG